MESKTDCDAVQSNRVNIESVIAAEAQELEIIAELERQIELEKNRIAKMV